MSQTALLVLATVLYAGYNLFIKVSGGHVPAAAITTISATLVLQFAALGTSLAFAGFLLTRGTDIFTMPPRVYVWAALAGVCIGAAEITYLYLFGGIGAGSEPMAANVAIPFVIGGTIVITLLVSAFVFHEQFSWLQMTGAGLILLGLLFLLVENRWT